ncbi:MAG TPA: hypothetical protein PKZ53_23465 [Acidobacteriota bacterium]|nr:hypothetical protein [Acidobacteriota bacterium]HNJ43462.1 hypothetical protein [Acidobacteriota bacterium]
MKATLIQQTTVAQPICHHKAKPGKTTGESSRTGQLASIWFDENNLQAGISIWKIKSLDLKWLKRARLIRDGCPQLGFRLVTRGN